MEKVYQIIQVVKKPFFENSPPLTFKSKETAEQVIKIFDDYFKKNKPDWDYYWKKIEIDVLDEDNAIDFALSFFNIK